MHTTFHAITYELTLFNRSLRCKDASRAIAISSLNPEDCIPDIFDLEDQDETVLEE